MDAPLSSHQKNLSKLSKKKVDSDSDASAEEKPQNNHVMLNVRRLTMDLPECADFNASQENTSHE